MPARTSAPRRVWQALAPVHGSWLPGLLLVVVSAGTGGSHAGEAPAWEVAPPPQVRPLEADGEGFQALYSPARTQDSQGTVVLVAGLGTGPDAPGVVRAIRGGLPAHGWDTLSLALPAVRGDLPLAHQPVTSRGVARVRAAVASLGGDGPVVVAGHGAGALSVAAYLEAGVPDRVVGLVALNPRAIGESQTAAADRLRAVGVPVMLVVGSRASSDVLALSSAYRSGLAPGAGGRLVEVPGADQSFWRAEQIVLDRLRGWLRGLPKKPKPEPEPQ